MSFAASGIDYGLAFGAYLLTSIVLITADLPARLIPARREMVVDPVVAFRPWRAARARRNSLRYSCLKATTGSTREARRAGIQQPKAADNEHRGCDKKRDWVGG